MNDLNSRLLSIVQAKPETDLQAWFATIDAAQVSHDKNIEWQPLAEQNGWGNLLGGSREGKEPDLTCWLAPLTESVFAQTTELVRYHPYACTWFLSHWPIHKIGALWQQASNVRLPNGQHGLLRFYDPCVLLPLRDVLREHNWRLLCAPIVDWCYLDRQGKLAVLENKPGPILSPRQFSLNEEQVWLLKQAGRVDRFILQMQADEILPPKHDPFAVFGHVSQVLEVLEKNGISKRRPQYQFVAMTLDWPRQHFKTEGLEQALSRFDQGTDDLLQFVTQHSPRQEILK